MPRCAIYARFSTDKQSANSAEDQITDCQQLALREGWEVVGVYTDLAISGASNRRPGMTQMLADAAAGAFDIVTAEAVDRLARNQSDIAMIFQRLEFANVRIHTLSEGPINEMVIGFKGTMSAMFLKDLADKIRRGQRGTVSRGRVPGGLTYGYDVVPMLDAKGELDRGHRRINAEQADVVRRIYGEFVAGSSPKAIAQRLNADGIPAPRGGEWRGSTIYGSPGRLIGVLRNPVYAGRYVYNRVQMRRDPDSRKRVSRCNASADRVEVAMPDLRIVEDHLFQAAQDELAARASGPLNARPRAQYLLSGLVRCGQCGGSVVIVGGGRMGCIRNREAGTCDVGRTISRVALETRVVRGLADRLLAPEAVSLLVKRYHDEIASKSGDRTKAIAAIDKRIVAIERAIARLVSAIADGAADFADIREALTARKAERDELKIQREEAKAVPVIALNPAIVDRYRQRVRQLALSLGRETPTKSDVTDRLRELIAGVKLTPLNDKAWEVELLTSLGGVVAMAAIKKPKHERVRRSVQVVAEEGFEPPTPGL